MLNIIQSIIYINIITTLKRDLEIKYYSDQLDNNKADIKNHGIS